MNAITLYNQEAPGQRGVFAALLALVWIAMISGFGIDSARHIAAHGLDYPIVVHLHALVFTAWLVLFTAQVLLIRNNDVARHRRLGKIGAGLAMAMIVLGIVTALIVAARNYDLKGETPEFLAIEFIDLAVFGGFTGAALALRRHRATHKRLMLLGLFYLSAPGFARAINGVLTSAILAVVPLQSPPAHQFLHIFTGPNLLIAALGVYDLIAYRRLYRAYVIGVIYIAISEIVGIYLLNDPTWRQFCMTLIDQLTGPAGPA